MQLSEKLYWYPWKGRANNCNSFLLKGSQVILFDPGHIENEINENCLEMLSSRLQGDGVTLEDIDLILCTHGHPDHTESVGAVREKSGAPAGIHQADDFILEGIMQHYKSRTGEDLPSIKADFYLEEGPLQKANGLTLTEKIEVITSPGHSPGCVCFYLPDEKALVSGDTIFQNSIGRTDFPGGDMSAMQESVEKLSQLENVELLLPGHMGFVTGADSVKRNFEQIKRYFFS